MKRLILCTAAIVAIAASTANAAGTAVTPTQSITIAPASIDQSVRPGSVTNGSFQIINSGNTVYAFRVYATPYRVVNEAYDPDFTALPGAPDVSGWFHFSQSSSTIATRQAVVISYSIHVPAGTPAGGYYAIAFGQTKSKPSPTTGVVVTDRVGEIFYLRVAGNAKQSGKLVGWQANLVQQSPLAAAVRVEDNGSYNFPAAVKVNVRNVFGKTIYSFNTTRQLLPRTIRRIPVSWKMAPTLGIFKVSGTVHLLNRTTQLPTKYVIFMPPAVRLALAGLVILIVIKLAAVLYKRGIKKNKSRGSGHNDQTP